MAKLIRCECGFVARGDTDDQVVAAIREHMATDHPALLGRSAGRTCSAGSRSSSARRRSPDRVAARQGFANLLATARRRTSR